MHIKTNLHAGEITVYGANWCGWTKKQRAYLDKKNLPYQYVDCDSQACPDFVSGFPTVVKDGRVMEGFQAL